MSSVEVAARCGRQGRFASSTNAIVSKGALAGLRAGETGCGRTETGSGCEGGRERRMRMR